MKTFCPNCEKNTEREHTVELYECKECGEDFAKYIVSRNQANSDVSMTEGVLTDIKTGQSIDWQSRALAAEARVGELGPVEWQAFIKAATDANCQSMAADMQKRFDHYAKIKEQK